MNFSSGFGLKASFTGLRKFNFYIKRIKFIRDRTILFSENGERFIEGYLNKLYNKKAIFAR